MSPGNFVRAYPCFESSIYCNAKNLIRFYALLAQITAFGVRARIVLEIFETTPLR